MATDIHITDITGSFTADPGDKFNFYYDINCNLVVLPKNDAFSPSIGGEHAIRSKKLNVEFTGKYAEAWIICYDSDTQVMHSIHTTSSGPLNKFEKTFQTQLEAALTARGSGLKSVFCECWTCFSKLAKALINSPKLPLPAQVKAAITIIVTAGDALYPVICKKGT